MEFHYLLLSQHPLHQQLLHKPVQQQQIYLHFHNQCHLHPHTSHFNRARQLLTNQFNKARQHRMSQFNKAQQHSSQYNKVQHQLTSHHNRVQYLLKHHNQPQQPTLSPQVQSISNNHKNLSQPQNHLQLCRQSQVFKLIAYSCLKLCTT